MSSADDPSLLQAQSTQAANNYKSKILVLCFDGTGNQYSVQNSNVIRFYTALKKNHPESQLCYYMPGLGTYTKQKYFIGLMNNIACTLDALVASSISERIKDGYTFLMHNYREGDKICLVGFSRGAYTARALSGMIYKVGLLPPHNAPQVDFAYRVYSSSSAMGSTARKFKETFSLDVCIDLVGVWDTVSSVGVFPQILPYSTGNVGIKVFRHALALDEQRARFRPCMWGEPAEVGDGIRELEEPRVKSWPTPKSWSHWSYEPHPAPDVQEVWFTGCHADIGGGSHRDEVSHGQSLSNITLRWMIRECYSANIGISFDNDVLRSYGLFLNELKRPIIIPSGHHDSDPHDVNNDCDTASTIRSVSPANSNDSYYLKTFDSDDDDHSLESSWDESREEGEEKEEEEKRKREEGEKENGGKNNAEEEDEEEGDGEGDDATLKAKATDAMSTIYNQLDNQPWWWFLELIPTVSVQQLQSGKWLRYRRRNLGFGRYIPHASGSVSVHKSVQDRIAGAGLEKGYKPAASNWEEVEGKVKWVD